MQRFMRAGFFVAVALGAGAAHLALASGSATIVGLYPAAEVPMNTVVSFEVQTSGFSNPTFYLIDSFGGGATTVNIDSNGNFSWTPNQDEVGSHTLTIQVSDSLGDSASVSQTIVVDGAPSVSISSLSPGDTVSVGMPVSFSVSSSGFLQPSYSVGDNFSASSVQSYDLNSSGIFMWTPVYQDIGTHTLTVTGSDSHGGSATAQTTITVLGPAVLTLSKVSPGAQIEIGQPFSFVATTTGFVSPSFTLADAFSELNSTSPTLDAGGSATWTPTKYDVGTHTLTVTASDSLEHSQTATLNVEVLDQTYSAPAQPASSTPVQTNSTTGTPSPPPAPAQSQPQSTPVPQTTKTSTSESSNTSSPSSPASALPEVSVSQTPVSSTNPEAPNFAISAPEAPITLPPQQSFGQFVLQGVANFIAKIFSIF